MFSTETENEGIGQIAGGSAALVLRNYWNGTFISLKEVHTGTSGAGVAIGDLDGDGHLDFVVTDKDDNTVSVIKNTSQ